MAQFGNADIVAAQLEKVRPKVPQLFDRESTWYSTIEKKNVEEISKREMRIPLELTPGGQFGHFNPAGGDMGRGSGPFFDKAVVSVVNLRHALEWTTESDWATDTNRKSVVKAVNHIIAGAMKEFRRNVDSLCLTGGNGVLGTVTSVSNAGGYDTVTLTTDGFGAKLLRKGQKITYYLSDLSAVRHSSGVETQITYLDYRTKQIKTATTTGLAAGDVILPEGLSGASPTSILGVPYHHNNASTGSWLGLSRTDNPEIRASRVTANAGLSLAHARLAVNAVGDRLGQEEMQTMTAWMHPCQVQAYEELGQTVSMINKEAKEQNLNLYFNDNMQLAGCPIRKHFSWDKTRIDFMTNQWGRAVMHEADWYEVQGRRIFEIRGTSGGVAAAQVTYITASFQMFHGNPAGAVYISGLTVPNGY